jgi:hypothetical protein
MSGGSNLKMLQNLTRWVESLYGTQGAVIYKYIILTGVAEEIKQA